jgi:hypothetical protein
MNESQIIKSLSRIKSLPEKEWQESMIKYIDKFQDKVTNPQKSRNKHMNIFYFLNKTVMNVRLTVGAIVGTAIVLVGGGIVTVYASDAANPGDFLFPIDTAAESLQRSLINDPIAKAQFELSITNERISELLELSATENKSAIALAIGEVNAEQVRLQERLTEMDQLRTQDRLKVQDQLNTLEQLKTQTSLNNQTMLKIQEELQQNGDSENKNSLNEVQTQYTNQVQQSITNFETTTGLSVQESEENSGNNTEIQNQNQTQNGTTTPTNQGGNGQVTVTPRTQQGK